VCVSREREYVCERVRERQGVWVHLCVRERERERERDFLIYTRLNYDCTFKIPPVSCFVSVYQEN